MLTYNQHLLKICNHNQVHAQIHLARVVANLYIRFIPIFAKRVGLELSLSSQYSDDIIFVGDEINANYPETKTELGKLRPINVDGKRVIVPEFFFNSKDIWSGYERFTLGRILKGEKFFRIGEPDEKVRNELLIASSEYLDTFIKSFLEDCIINCNEQIREETLQSVAKIIYKVIFNYAPELLCKYEDEKQFIDETTGTGMREVAKAVMDETEVNFFSLVNSMFLKTIFDDINIHQWLVSCNEIYQAWLDHRNGDEESPNIEAMALDILYQITTRPEDVIYYNNLSKEMDENNLKTI